MKKRLLASNVAALTLLATANAAFAAPGLIPTRMPISDMTCALPVGGGGYSFVAHWGPLIHPATKKVWLDPKTSKPWPKYRVAVRNGCSVPNAGAVTCSEAGECSIPVNCPLRSYGTNVRVIGVGVTDAAGRPIRTSTIYTEGGRKPGNCQ